jgi:hypothetical protein
MRADAFVDCDRRALGGRGSCFSLVNHCEGERTERGETAGGDAGPAQECTAVDPVTQLGDKRNSEMAAACLAFCFLV